MGILHAVANSPVDLGELLHALNIMQVTTSKYGNHADPSSPLAKIFEDCKAKTPEERAAYLETSSHVESAHSSAAQTGQSHVRVMTAGRRTIASAYAGVLKNEPSQVPSSDEEVDLHFSCFVAADVKGQTSLVELDGRRPGPIVRKSE